MEKHGRATVEMTHSPSTFKLGLEFNAFLFAPIWDGAGEGSLTVASALARLDIDPWREAAELAVLRDNAAARRLASRLAEIPAENPPPDLMPIAVRLVALLPQRPGPLNSLRPISAVRVSTPLLMVLIAVSVVALASVAFNLDKSTRQTMAPAALQHASPVGPSQAHP